TGGELRQLASVRITKFEKIDSVSDPVVARYTQFHCLRRSGVHHSCLPVGRRYNWQHRAATASVSVSAARQSEEIVWLRRGYEPVAFECARRLVTERRSRMRQR